MRRKYLIRVHRGREKDVHFLCEYVLIKILTKKYNIIPELKIDRMASHHLFLVDHPQRIECQFIEILFISLPNSLATKIFAILPTIKHNFIQFILKRLLLSFSNYILVFELFPLRFTKRTHFLIWGKIWIGTFIVRSDLFHHLFYFY